MRNRNCKIRQYVEKREAGRQGMRPILLNSGTWSDCSGRLSATMSKKTVDARSEETPRLIFSPEVTGT